MNRNCAIVNGKFVTADAVLENRVLLIQDGKIQALALPGEFNPAEYSLIDAHGCIVTPGLIDLHIHGCLRHTFNEPTREAFETILKKTLSIGVTTLAPTLFGAPIPELTRSLAHIGAWRRNQTLGMTEIAGAYLESPYIALEAKGALPASAIRGLQDGSLDRLLEHAEALKIFMLAPELPGAPEAVRKIVQKGIIAAMGHTTAIEADIEKVIAAGASHVTHLWSAMSSVVRHGPWRKPGLLEVTLTHPELTAEIIADNKHLPPTLMKLAVNAKSPMKSLCAVSDALNGAGLAEGEHFLVGENEYEVVDGVGMVADRSCFTGSTTLLNQEILVLLQAVGLSLPTAIEMVTQIPSKILGLDQQKGSLRAGLDADIAIFDPSFEPIYVLQQGIIVKEPPQEKK